MKKIIAAIVLCFAVQCVAQDAQKKSEPVTLKSLLLTQLKETHNQKNWFVSGKEAMAGITPEQTAWTDGKNHSVGQLVRHIVFWNANFLSKLQGDNKPAPSDNNETFKYDPKQWDSLVQQFDKDMTKLEEIVGSADDASLQKMAPTVARVAMHNACHIGEIVMVRKEQGSWNPETGVK